MDTKNTILCRTCLSVKNLKPIFTNGNKEKRTKQLLNATGVKIEPNDGFSQFICKECTLNIKISLRLRRKSANAEVVLYMCQRRNTGLLETTSNQRGRYDNQESNTSILDGDQGNEFDKQEDNIVTEMKHKNAKTNSNQDNDCDSIDSELIVPDCKNGELDKSDGRKRCRLSQDQTQKLMSLAVMPYDKEGPVECRLCHKRLKAVRYFRNHAKTHFEAEHGCESCGKKFVSVGALRSHQQRMHGADKRHACLTCGFTAVDTSQLQNHIRSVHTGERPFVCDVCGESFTIRAGIAQHMRTHFATKCIQCERCPAMFRSRSELALHRNKVHLMSYTYYCYLCPGKYKGVSTVKNHIVKTHGIPRNQHLPIKCVKEKRESVSSEKTIIPSNGIFPLNV